MKIVKYLIIFSFFYILTGKVVASEQTFDEWINEFKIYAEKKGISKITVNKIMNNANFLPKVIQYDRYQPEFYEDTKTYIGKRVTKQKIKKGKLLYNSERDLIEKVENKFSVEKELLLALMGIETNFGNYLGKMDIVSSLATLSYDKRRSEFFKNELIVLLKLIDKKQIDPSILYGSWAGAFGNFQFMPSTISNYAIDYDSNSEIELKKIDDSFASAANYINKIGWNNKQPCYIKIDLKDSINDKYLNTSAKKIKNKKKLIFFKKYIKNYNELTIDPGLSVGIITPDRDIVDNSNRISPAYLVFNNYEIILKWNRSLRFSLAVCTLKDKFKNEL